MDRKFSRFLWLTLGLALVSPVQADDTDIYFTASASTADEPLVMFSIDWRPNLTATVCNGNECDSLYKEGYLTKNPATETINAFDLYRAVLKKVFEPLKGVKVGLMINHDNGIGQAGCSGFQNDNTKCTNGGFIALGFQSLQENDANGAKKAFHEKLKSLPLPQGFQSHKWQGSELFFEFFRYLTGQSIYNGHNGWTDFGTNDTQNINEESHGFGWDSSIETNSGSQYISPLGNASACVKIFTVNIFFGTIDPLDKDAETAIKAAKDKGGMAGINLGSKNEDFRSVLAWLRDIDLGDGTFGSAPDLEGQQSVISYFLAPKPGKTENDFAKSGGTNRALALSENPDELVETLSGIFREILSISTTFVSASVPVNAFNRAEIVDNVYLALFQPKVGPNWPGNVKKLKIDVDGAGNTVLVDASGTPAVSLDGRVKYDALTFWTDAAALPPLPDNNVTGDEANFVVAGKDGRFVPRGGAGQRIPGINGSGSSSPGLTNSDTGARKLYTEPASGTTLLALNADITTAAALRTALGAATDVEALCLLKYARGYDVTSLTSCVSPGVRSWLMGDPLHSRPLPVNYGGDLANPDIRILVGSNDGYMRMIRNTNGSAESGKEVWAFMPREVMPVLKKFQGNTGHPYAVDGAPVAYIKDVNDDGTISSGAGDKVWLFFGLRRGGNAYYALDISDPDAPKFLWSIDKSGDFAELGLTFSTPRVGMLDWGSGKKPVLVFGGGYAKNKDDYATDDPEGNALFLVDAETGDLVWKGTHSGLVDSIPSDVAAVDSNNDGLLDRLYVGDTGGIVWRADIQGDTPSNWTLTPLLSVGRHATGVDRRFFHRPDVVLTKDDNGAFDAVIIGSGDRENPLDTTVVNQFYMVKDRNIVSGTPPTTTLTPSSLADLTDNCLQDQDVDCASEPNLEHGWRITLAGTGEKSLATPVTLNGAIFFTTYLPPTSSGAQCGPSEGNGALYAVSLHEAAAVLNFDSSTDGDGGGVLQEEDRFRLLKSGGIPSEIVLIPTDKGSGYTGGVDILPPDLTSETLPTTLGWKTFWYQEVD